MAKRRTRKQKQKISQKRKSAKSSSTIIGQSRLISADHSSTEHGSHKNKITLEEQKLGNAKSNQITSEKSLLRVNAHFLATDMLRSLVITAILIISLIGIYIYLRYN